MLMSASTVRATPSTMRAVHPVKANSPFAVTALPVPEPGPGQVRVKVNACGVCAGDNIARLGLLGVKLPRAGPRNCRRHLMLSALASPNGKPVSVLESDGTAAARDARVSLWTEAGRAVRAHRRGKRPCH
jgi:NADPH:quinone reductase-like Zn-dependent oxidoreductase